MSPDQIKENISIQAVTRTESGKGNRRIRKAGNIPANIFGEGKDSCAITIPYKDFVRTYKLAGESQVVYVLVDKKEEPTIIGEIQKDPLDNSVTHVNFKRVNLRKKVEAEIPLATQGESEAVEKKHGELNILHDHLTVSALPSDLPHEIYIDITPLMEIGDEILLRDIPITGSYEFLDEPETVVIKVSAHTEHSVEPETTSEDAPEILSETPETDQAEQPAE